MPYINVPNIRSNDRRSLPGAAVAKSLLSLIAAGTPLRASTVNGTVPGSACGSIAALRYTVTGRETEGGALLLAINFWPEAKLEHTSGPLVSTEHTIRSLSRAGSINRAFTAACRAWAEAAQVASEREALCKLAELREIPDDIENMHPAASKTYDSLTLAECRELTTIVGALPLKKAA